MRITSGFAHAGLWTIMAGSALAQFPSPAGELNQALPYWLRFSGEERVRAEGALGSGFKANSADGYLLNRFRFDVSIAPVSWFKVNVETQDSRVFWKDQKPYAPPYQDTWDLRLAYLELGDVEKDHVGFRAGRQELAFGEERILGVSNWSNVARSFDGYRAMFQAPGIRVDAFTASIVVLHDGQVGEHTPGNYLHGIYGHFDQAVPDSVIEPYFLWRRSPLQKLENGQLGTADFGTLGFRWVVKPVERVDVVSELAMQRGSLKSDRLSAWASHLVLGYQLPVPRVKTRYIVEYNFASGDANNKDGRHGTFDPLYPSGHDKMDLADQVGWKNMQHFRTGPEFVVSKKVKASFKYSDYWLANTHDALYNSSGTAIARNAQGKAGRWVGQELDATFTYSLSKGSQLGAGYGYLLPGTFLKLTTPGHSFGYPFLFYTTTL